MHDEAKAKRTIDFINSLKHTKGKWHGVPFTLLPWQQKIISDIFGTVKENGYRQYNTAYIEIPKKNGKQLALDTPIPTPDGFKTMGEIKPGDKVFDENGDICSVVAKSMVDDTEQAYKLTFRDGSTIIAGENHLWDLEYTHGKTQHKIWKTKEIYENIKNYRERFKDNPQEARRSIIRIPVTKPLKTSNAKLPLDAYTYGYWLGNGNSTKPELTVRDSDVQDIISFIPYNLHNCYPQKCGGSHILVYKELKNILVDNFRDKIIPPQYLRASEAQRWELLQGLMDSDGCISTEKSQSIYVSTIKQLAESVRELLWSLGIKNTIHEKPSTRFNVPTGETLYIIRFTTFDDQPTSKLRRKISRNRERLKKTRSCFHYLENIEPLNEKIKMQCIQVDSKSHCYLAGKSMIPTHNSELAAGVALYLTCGDMEWGAEVYGCASDRQQASIVFDVAVDMVDQCPALKKRIKPIMSVKRLVYKPTNSFYQVLSSEAFTKHGLNVHGVIFDELHAQPNRDLFDVMTMGSGDARSQPLFFLITTAGTDRESICFEQHQKAIDISEGRKIDPTFYSAIYGLPDTEDWTKEENWYKANPSLGYTIDIEKVRNACLSAMENPAEENIFRQLRLNQWVKQSTRWMSMQAYDDCNDIFDIRYLKGRECYGGLDLSTTLDLTAFVLVFPPRSDSEKFIILPYFWIPEDNLKKRVNRDHVPYDVWNAQGHIRTTPGNVVDYRRIEEDIKKLASEFVVKEIAYDRYNATQIILNLMDEGLTMVPFGQGFKDMSPPTKEFFTLVLKNKIIHNMHPVLRWNFDNVCVETDAAENIKPSKKHSTERIDGAVATIMALDRAIRNTNANTSSVYDERGIFVI